MHARVGHNQIAAFDNLDPHLPRQVSVLEIGAVVSPWRQQDDGGIRHARRRDVLQHFQQFLRVIIDRPHADLLEHVGKAAFHGPPVLQHVTDPAGTAPVVLQHPVGPVVAADQVGAANVNVDVFGHVEIDEFAPKMFAGKDVVCGDDTVLDDLLLVINIVQEEVQGRNPLHQPALQEFPFLGRDDARHQIKGKNPLRPLRVAIDVEGDALAQEGQIDRMPFVGELLGAERLKQSAEMPVMGTDFTALIEHFVEEFVAAIISQHQSKSSILRNLLILRPIKAIFKDERRRRMRWEKGFLGTSVALVKANEQSHLRDPVPFHRQPILGATTTHARTKAIRLPNIALSSPERLVFRSGEHTRLECRGRRPRRPHPCIFSGL
jgi:hypothetical protein